MTQKKKTATSKKKVQPTPKMTKVEVPIIETYDLVTWPDGCPEVPTYFQLCSTLEIVEMYQAKPESFKPGLAKTLEKWLKDNSIPKFRKALETAEEVQERLDRVAEEFIEDNQNFRLNKPRYNH